MSDVNANIPAPAFKEEVVYFECRHNLAFSLGRVSFDGCQEFFKSENGGDVRDAMLCDACSCHRSFHRRVLKYRYATQVENANAISIGLVNPDPKATINNGEEAKVTPMRQRRKRTVFSPEQKNRMRSFAENLGWRRQKSNKKKIEQFCLDMGMSHQVFLVWLNNNRRRVDKNTTAAA